MIRDTLDAANELANGITQQQHLRGEVVRSIPHKTAGLVPEESTFVLETVEGNVFRVTVSKEEN